MAPTSSERACLGQPRRLRRRPRRLGLAWLTEGPKYGLQLRHEFEARTGQVWPLNVGQVYLTLQRLERDALIESDDADRDGPQKSFRITPAGADEPAEWLRTPPDLANPPRDQLVIKVLVALRLPGVDLSELLQAHRRLAGWLLSGRNTTNVARQPIE